jgi:cell division protein FtsL
MTRVNALLLLAVMCSALYLVRTQYESRRLYTELYRAKSQAQRLENEYDRLDIERGAQATPLRVEKNGTYHGRVTPPASGYTAFFVELVYDSGGRYPFKLTTEVSVVPDVLPHQWKEAAAKYATTKK